MSTTELPALADLRDLANELEHNERLHAIDGRDSFPVDWVSKFHIRPFPIYIGALRIAARAADRAALAKVCGKQFANNDERVAAIQLICSRTDPGHEFADLSGANVMPCNVAAPGEPSLGFN